jgi:hypothetical protein
MFYPTSQTFIPTSTTYTYSTESSPLFSDSLIINSNSSPIITEAYYTPNNINTGLTKQGDFIYSPVGPSQIITQQLYVDPFKPITSTIDYSYTKPLFGIYQDLNNDSYTVDRVTKYFHNLTLDKWLFNELSDILNYFVIDAKGYVDLVPSMSEYKSDNVNKFSKRDMERIVDFIEKFFLTLSVTRRTLDKFVKESNVRWVDLPHSKFFVRQVIGEKIMKLIRSALYISAQKK